MMGNVKRLTRLMHGKKAKKPKKRRCISRETRERLDGELKEWGSQDHMRHSFYPF